MVELDWFSFVGLLIVAGFVGSLTPYFWAMWGAKPNQEIHLEAATPLEREYLGIPVEPEVAHYSIEKHLELVHYMGEILEREKERLNNEFRESSTKTD